MAKSIPGQLSMFDLPIWQDSPSATSSPESVDGALPSASPDGQTTAPSGREAARASRSASQAKAPVQTIQGTCGLTSIASSPPTGPLSSWESRLRERLGTGGSMEFELIWKQLATPGVRSIFRLSRSTPRTFASGSTGSHSTWPTPRAVDGDKGSRTPEGCEKEIARKGRLDDLPSTVMHNLSTWPTPTSQDCARGVGTIRPQDTGIPLPQRVAQVIGTTTSGSPDQTGKPGALNPAFPCWLMGYPTAWDACAPTATPSSRRSRQK